MYIHVTWYVYLRSFMKSSSFWNTKSECCCVGAVLFFSYFFKNFNNVHVLVNITKCMTFVIRFSITKCFWKRCIFRCCCITTFNFHWSKCNISEHRVEIACTHLLALYFPSSTMLSLLYIRRHLVGGIVPQMFRTYISINSVSHWHRIFIFFICPFNKQFLTAKWIKVFFLTMRVYLINY